MNKTFLIFAIISIFCFCISTTTAQYVTIPDSNFVNWLNANGYTSCLNGNQMDTTCSLVINTTKVNCSNSNISSLLGISYFDNLDTLNCSYNQLFALPILPLTLDILMCQNNQISSLPSLPPQLKFLDCGYNLLYILPLLPQQLEILACNWNQLSSLPLLPATLVSLNCYNNQINVLPTFSPNLIGIECYGNPFSTLPALPSGLDALRCGSSNLTNLPALPATLRYLECIGAQLTSLPTLPTSLEHLDCTSNSITALPTLPPLIKYLDFKWNQVATLPNLPNSLLYLSFGYNQISVIPTLPSLLQTLFCETNLLTYLPTLPSNLSNLYCENNLLTYLPTLPSSLSTLYCSFNLIANLPSLPPYLRYFNCNNNVLNNFPEFPDSLNTLHIENNPNLYCFPPLKKIKYFYFSNTGIQCLPNYGSITNSIPSISSYPLCDVFNGNGCQAFWNISGRSYFDFNNNCIVDGNENGMGNLKILLDSSGTLIQQTYTGGEGRYSFDTKTGIYLITVDTTDLPVTVTCPIGGIQNSNLTLTDSTDFDVNFAVQCKPGFDIGVTSIAKDSGTFRPAHFVHLRLAAGDISRQYGLQCANGISGTVTVIISGPVSYISATTGSLTPIVNQNTLTYSVSNFGTLNFNTAFSFTMQVDTNASQGAIVCYDITITPTSGDLNISNNTLQNCFTIVNSFDPNEKEVFPVGTVNSLQDWLTYTIHFQNTGTAPAEHIYITDTLDANLDELSFQLLSYSHYNITQLFGKVIHFNFPAINLPDSVNNEPNSHGFIQYRIRPNSGLNNGIIIQNTANIFFDFNAPVITNSVVNTVLNNTGLVSPVEEPIYVDIFPNPASNHQLTIRHNFQISNNTFFKLHEVSGRMVFKILINSLDEQLVVLPENLSGVYFGSLVSNKFILNKKIVLE